MQCRALPFSIFTEAWLCRGLCFTSSPFMFSPNHSPAFQPEGVASAFHVLHCCFQTNLFSLKNPKFWISCQTIPHTTCHCCFVSLNIPGVFSLVILRWYSTTLFLSKFRLSYRLIFPKLRILSPMTSSPPVVLSFTFPHFPEKIPDLLITMTATFPLSLIP